MENIDLTDNLHDADSHARDCGYVCTGHYDRAQGIGYNHRHEDVTVDLLVLQGISIDRGLDRVNRYNIKDAALILGADAMSRIEIVEAAQ